MPAGGAMLTLTYNGGQRAMPNYNVMGVAKAALEASVRYLAVDFGPAAIRVNAISAGPIRTLAGAGMSDARQMFVFQQRHSPLRRGVTLDEIGGAALYLLSELSTGVTGDIHFVNSGYNIITMPQPSALRSGEGFEEMAIRSRMPRSNRGQMTHVRGSMRFSSRSHPSSVVCHPSGTHEPSARSRRQSTQARHPAAGVARPTGLDRHRLRRRASRTTPALRECGRFAMLATAGSHLIINSMHDFRGLLSVNADNVLTVAGALLVPRLHRFGEHVGAIALLLMILFGHTFIVWSLARERVADVFHACRRGIVLFRRA